MQCSSLKNYWSFDWEQRIKLHTECWSCHNHIVSYSVIWVWLRKRLMANVSAIRHTTDKVDYVNDTHLHGSYLTRMIRPNIKSIRSPVLRQDLPSISCTHAIWVGIRNTLCLTFRWKDCMVTIDRLFVSIWSFSQMVKVDQDLHESISRASILNS